MVNWISLKLDSSGLIPAVVQDDKSDAVLMVAWMNEDAFNRTLKTGQVHFWSRSRKEIGRKGETSGNTLQLVELWMDCDADTLLLKVNPAGPVCHTGKPGCFFQRIY